MRSPRAIRLLASGDPIELIQSFFGGPRDDVHRYAVRGKFSTWLFTIAANLCRNYLRWRQRRGESASETWDTEDAKPAESLQSQEDSPDQAAMRSESISLIRVAIDKLPHDLKTVILLYEYQSLSYAEISSVLGCSVKAVEMKLYRAKHLRRERFTRNDLR